MRQTVAVAAAATFHAADYILRTRQDQVYCRQPVLVCVFGMFAHVRRMSHGETEVINADATQRKSEQPQLAN